MRRFGGAAFAPGAAERRGLFRTGSRQGNLGFPFGELESFRVSVPGSVVRQVALALAWRTHQIVVAISTSRRRRFPFSRTYPRVAVSSGSSACSVRVIRFAVQWISLTAVQGA